MSNLGPYLVMTKLAKKVGGPINLAMLTAASGAALYKCGEVVCKRAIKAVNRSKKEKNAERITEDIYMVDSPVKFEGGLEFDSKDKFRVLASDGDSVMVEKLGDNNNPYFVSGEQLKKISDLN